MKSLKCQEIISLVFTCLLFICTWLIHLRIKKVVQVHRSGVLSCLFICNLLYQINHECMCMNVCMFNIKYQQYCYGFWHLRGKRKPWYCTKLLAEGQFHVYPWLPPNSSDTKYCPFLCFVNILNLLKHECTFSLRLLLVFGIISLS